jgi:FtsZ-interacting cell division protein ZipA
MRLAQLMVAALAILLLIASGFWWQSHNRGISLAEANGNLSISLKKEKEAREDAEKKSRIAVSEGVCKLTSAVL